MVKKQPHEVRQNVRLLGHEGSRVVQQNPQLSQAEEMPAIFLLGMGAFILRATESKLAVKARAAAKKKQRRPTEDTSRDLPPSVGATRERSRLGIASQLNASPTVRLNAQKDMEDEAALPTATEFGVNLCAQRRMASCFGLEIVRANMGTFKRVPAPRSS